MRDREQLSLTIFEQVPIGINQISPEGRSIRANLALQHFLGYTNQEMYGRFFTEWTHPDDVASSIQLVQQFHLGKCDRESFEKRYIRKDGKIVWGHTTATAIRDENGNIDYVIVTVDDITDRKKSEELLKSINKLLLEINKADGLSKTLQLCLKIAIRTSEMDCGGIYLLDNQGELKLSESKGLSETFLDGARYYSAESPNTRLVKQGKPVYARHCDLDATITGPDRGESLKAFAAIPIYHDEMIIGCLNVASHTLDKVPGPNRRSLEAISTVMGLIISRARVGESMRESEYLFRTVFECSRDAKFIIDQEGRFIRVNRAAADLMGCTIGEMRNMSLFDFQNPREHEIIQSDLKRIMNGEDMLVDVKIRRKDGAKIDTVFNNTRIRINGMLHMYATARDVTERKRLEGEYKKAIRSLENREKDLRGKSVHLEELNVALKVLLDQREQEKKSIEEGFSGGISGLIFPYLDRIRKTGLDELQMEHINILESNLREIIRPYKHRISEKLTRLSPSETRIVNYLRQGYGNKEIASMLNVSPRTVEFHRDNIRKKLGLKNRKVNLRTYLAGLP